MATPTLRLSPGSVLRAVVIVGVCVVVAGIVVRAAHPLMWFLQASVVAALSWPAIRLLSRHMPSWVAVLGLTLVAALAVGLLGAVGFSELQDEAQRFQRSAPAAARRLQEDAPLGGLLADVHLSDQADRIATEVGTRFRISGSDLPGLASQVGGGVSATFVVWVLAVMLVFAGPGMVDAGVGWLRPTDRDRAHDLLRAAYGDTLRYLGLTSLRALGVGVLTYLVADVLGIDLPALLAVLAAVLAFVPYVGIGLAALVVALLAVLNGAGESVAVLCGGIALQVADALVVQPRVRRASFRFGLFPTLVVTMLGFSLYGPSGIFVGLTLGCMAVAVVQRRGEAQLREELRSSRDASPSNVDGGASPPDTRSSTASSSSSTSAT
jgi:predicted PurR-regulated permease PerM